MTDAGAADDDTRHQQRTSRPRPISASLSTLPFNDVFLANVANVATKQKPSKNLRPSSSGPGPPVPPRNPARSRRPATSGGGGAVGAVTPHPHQPPGLSTSGIPPTSVWSGPHGAGYSLKPLKASARSSKAESSSGGSERTQPLFVVGRMRRSSHDLSRPSRDSLPSTSSPATTATYSTSSKRRPTTTSGVITTPKQTSVTQVEKRDLNAVTLQAAAMTKPYFITKNGKKHHSFSSKRAPYPRNYERDTLDQYGLSMTTLPKELTHPLGSDAWNHLFFTRLCDSPTFHQFTQPPKRVLDLGCGHGLWVWLLPPITGVIALNSATDCGRGAKMA